MELKSVYTIDVDGEYCIDSIALTQDKDTLKSLLFALFDEHPDMTYNISFGDCGSYYFLRLNPYVIKVGTERYTKIPSTRFYGTTIDDMLVVMIPVDYMSVKGFRIRGSKHYGDYLTELPLTWKFC